MSFFSRLLNRPGPARLASSDFVARRTPDATVLDVRTPAEYASGHLAGALNVDVSAPDFPQQIEALAAEGTITAERPVYLYCRTGHRSGKATVYLREMGFSEAVNVGGFEALKAAGAEVER